MSVVSSGEVPSSITFALYETARRQQVLVHRTIARRDGRLQCLGGATGFA